MSSSRLCAAAIASPRPRPSMHKHRGLDILRGLTGGAAIVFVVATAAGAQTPAPQPPPPPIAQPQGMERLTFEEAVQRAIKANPSVGQASAGIMRAEAILQQTASSSMQNLSA